MATRSHGINMAQYKESQDKNYVIEAFTLIGVPTWGPARYRDLVSKKGRLVHWRLHARWHKEDTQELSTLNVAFDIESRSNKKGDLKPNKRVEICIQSRTNLFSPSARKTWQINIPLKAEAHFTVDSMIQFLSESRFRRYRSDHQGRGCLYWCLDLIRGLRDDKNLIASTHVTRMETYVEEKRTEAENGRGKKYWIPRDRGSYDRSDTAKDMRTRSRIRTLKSMGIKKWMRLQKLLGIKEWMRTQMRTRVPKIQITIKSPRTS